MNNIHLAVLNKFIDSSDTRYINNICSYTRRSILHWAAVHGNIPMMEYAIRSKINVNLQCKEGHTALHDAVMIRYFIISQETQLKMVEILLAAGVDMTIRNKNGHRAFSLVRPELLRKIRGIISEEFLFMKYTLLFANLLLEEFLLRETQALEFQQEENKEKEDDMELYYYIPTPDSEPFFANFVTSVHNSQFMWQFIFEFI
jgi:hypothetical protein